MQSAPSVVSSRPKERYHSTNASALKFAVTQGVFDEMSYHNCTFSIPVKTKERCQMPWGSERKLLGWIVLTTDENLDQLKQDIQAGHILAWLGDLWTN